MSDWGSTKKIQAPIVIAGVAVKRKGSFGKGIHLALSYTNLFNQRLKLASPHHDGGWDTFPYKGREISLSLGIR
ncbi:MAG: hypothetical protein MZV63_63685 [Marinilabiliales bacterium]|nr:hypothetical protein [Marinilabiliales bacterium]